MFGDVFGIDGYQARQHMKESGIEQAAFNAAFLEVMVSKGLVTVEEFQEALVRQRAAVDQVIAEVTEQQRREFAEKYPAIAKIFRGEEAT